MSAEKSVSEAILPTGCEINETENSDLTRCEDSAALGLGPLWNLREHSEGLAQLPLRVLGGCDLEQAAPIQSSTALSGTYNLWCKGLTVRV